MKNGLSIIANIITLFAFITGISSLNFVAKQDTNHVDLSAIRDSTSLLLVSVAIFVFLLGLIQYKTSIWLRNRYTHPELKQSVFGSFFYIIGIAGLLEIQVFWKISGTLEVTLLYSIVLTMLFFVMYYATKESMYDD